MTTWRPVPPGTNGGVTCLGTLASVAGGTLVGVTYFVVGLVVLPRGAAWPPGGFWTGEGLVLILGPAAGFFGSLVDSLLGATVQFSGYHEARKCVVSAPGPGVKPVAGIPLLSNNGVNLVASAVTVVASVAAAVALAGP